MHRVHTQKVKHGVRLSNKFNHNGRFADCYNCGKTVQIDSNLYYVQLVNPKDDQPKTQKGTRGNGRLFRVNREDNLPKNEFKSPPLFVFVDYKAITDEEGMQTLNMLCLEDAEGDEAEVFYG